VGGVIECVCWRPSRISATPLCDKLRRIGAKAMLCLPATKGFEIGQRIRPAPCSPAWAH